MPDEVWCPACNHQRGDGEFVGHHDTGACSGDGGLCCCGLTPAEIDAVLAMRAKDGISIGAAEAVLSGPRGGYASVHKHGVVIDTTFDAVDLPEVAAVLQVLAMRAKALP